MLGPTHFPIEASLHAERIVSEPTSNETLIRIGLVADVMRAVIWLTSMIRPDSEHLAWVNPFALCACAGLTGQWVMDVNEPRSRFLVRETRGR